MQPDRKYIVFFGIYKGNGLLGILLSSIIIAIIIYKSLKVIKNKNIKNYSEFIEIILKDNLSKKRFLKESIINIVNVFLLISFYIMIAGFTVCLKQEFNIPMSIGFLIIISFLLITLKKDINGIIKANNILIPILILLFIILGNKKIDNMYINEVNIELSWIVKAILYSSYNSIVLIPILIDLKKHIKKEGIIAITVGVINFILSIIIYFLLNSENISNVEIPILYIAETLGNKAKIIYSLVILIAIYTSAISVGHGLLKNISKTQTEYKKKAFIICLSSIFICQIGFSNLINLMYPIFGSLGLIQIIFLLKT